jgi:hypothetical protein
MARKASGQEQLDWARARVSQAKTVEELRAAQAVLLPLELGLSMKANGFGHWSLGRRDLYAAPPVYPGAQRSPTCLAWHAWQAQPREGELGT